MNLSKRSSSTNTVLPVINTGSNESPSSFEDSERNTAIAPPASSSRIPSTTDVADVFSKSVTITALILSPKATFSLEIMLFKAAILPEEYAITLPTGDAHGLEPVSVIWTPNILNLVTMVEDNLWSSTFFERLNPYRTYLSSTVRSMLILVHGW